MVLNRGVSLEFIRPKGGERFEMTEKKPADVSRRASALVNFMIAVVLVNVLAFGTMVEIVGVKPDSFPLFIGCGVLMIASWLGIVRLTQQFLALLMLSLDGKTALTVNIGDDTIRVLIDMANGKLGAYCEQERRLREQCRECSHLRELADNGELGALLDALYDNASNIAWINILRDPDTRNGALAMSRIRKLTKEGTVEGLGEEVPGQAAIFVTSLVRAWECDQERIAELEDDIAFRDDLERVRI